MPQKIWRGWVCDLDERPVPKREIDSLRQKLLSPVTRAIEFLKLGVGRSSTHPRIVAAFFDHERSQLVDEIGPEEFLYLSGREAAVAGLVLLDPFIVDRMRASRLRA